MATGEDQAESIVGNFAQVLTGPLDDGLRAEIGICFQFFLQSCLPSQAIDGFVFGCLDDPGARRFRDAVSSPLVDSGCKSVLRRVFSEFEIAKLAYESCNNPAPIRSIDFVYCKIGVRKHV